MLDKLKTALDMFNHDHLQISNNLKYYVSFECILFIFLIVFDTYYVPIASDFNYVKSLVLLVLFYTTVLAHLLQILLITVVYSTINFITCSFDDKVAKFIKDYCQDYKDKREYNRNRTMEIHGLWVFYNDLITSCTTCNKIFGFQVKRYCI